MMVKERFRCRGSVVVALVVTCQTVTGADWPAWRYDANRSAVSPAALPANLAPRWTCRYPAPRAAWPDPRLQFDWAFQPVVAGKTLVFGSSREDAVVALDTESGSEKWRFLTEGPVRLAPAIAPPRVYATSDDGCLYCLDMETGRLLWKFRGAPTEQKVLGNERLISMWPARGGPVIHHGVVYFAAGIWPFMGVFVYALDAEKGEVVWQNDHASAACSDRSRAAVAEFGTASPQGALAVAGEKLVVPSGRAWPVYFDLQSGTMSPHAVGIKDSSGGGDSQIAVSGDFLLMGGGVFSIRVQRALVFNAAAATVQPFATLPIIDQQTLYVSAGDGLAAHDLAGAKVAKLSGAYGRPLMRCDTKQLWKLPLTHRAEVMIKAGPRLYVAGAGWVAAVDLPVGNAQPTCSWRTTFSGTPGSLLAADDKLFVSTCEGAIHCFSGERVEARDVDRRGSSPPTAPGTAASKAQALLAKCQATEGYAFLVGVADDDLVEELIRQTKLHIVVLRRDQRERDRLHKRLVAAGLYGDRAAVLMADATTLPPYLASLIVCEDAHLAGFATDEVCTKTLYEALRPYGGVLCLASAGQLKLVRRDGGLPGAADWTHDAADAGNTWMGLDRRVKAPLGVLWFGGPSGDPRLFMQRHTDPPTARVCEGRMFLHGDDMMTAVDAYTGRVLWNRRLPKVRAYQNLRSNVQAGPPYEMTGETTRRAAFVAHQDGLYLAYGQTIECWDPATGATRAVWKVLAENGGESLFLGDLRLEGNVLVAGADFSTEDMEALFVAEDFRDIPTARLAETIRLLEAWAGDRRPAPVAGENDFDYLVRLSNPMLHELRLDDKVPPELRLQAEQDIQRRDAARTAAASIARFRTTQKQTHAPFLLIEHCNRRLLEAYFPALRKLPPKMHWSNLYPWDGTSTRALVALDRITGRILWCQRAQYGFPQKSLAVGRDKVFCLDRVDLAVEDVLRRRGLSQPTTPRLLAFDLRSGRIAWTQQENISGYEMFYSAAHDVLVQASAFDPAPEQWWNKPRDLGVRFIAYRGADGRLLWDRTFTLNRPGGGHRLWHNWLLHDDTILLESYRDMDAEFYGFDLLTGATKHRTNAVTGADQAWGFHRLGGCTKNVCSPNLVLFRSQSAGYYDMAGDSGTATLGGFRPGCKNSLIPAAGLLNAPNYASGCTCNFPVFTSLALVHAPEAEQWFSNDYPYDGQPVRRVGLNLGAPGDRRASDGTLWLDFPSVSGGSLDIPVSVTPTNIQWFYRHSSRISGRVPTWIVASGGEGIESLQLRLCAQTHAAAFQPRVYTVRLYFAEPEPLKPGERVFSVSLQGNEVIRNLDILAQTGVPNAGLIKEFRSIRAADTLSVSLLAKVGRTLLCGIELIAEEER